MKFSPDAFRLGRQTHSKLIPKTFRPLWVAPYSEFNPGALLPPELRPGRYLLAWLQPEGSIGKPNAKSSPRPGVAMSLGDKLVAPRTGLPQGSNSYRILGRGGHLRPRTWGPDQGERAQHEVRGWPQAPASETGNPILECAPRPRRQGSEIKD